MTHALRKTAAAAATAVSLVLAAPVAQAGEAPPAYIRICNSTASVTAFQPYWSVGSSHTWYPVLYAGDCAMVLNNGGGARMKVWGVFDGSYRWGIYPDPYSGCKDYDSGSVFNPPDTANGRTITYRLYWSDRSC